VDHGESPRTAVLRELREECGVDGTVGALVAVHDDHFSGTAPSGRYEDFHAVAMAFEVSLDGAADPVLAETDGTTDAVAWVRISDIESGALPVLDLVREALEGDR